jgi:hypothetical protein
MVYFKASMKTMRNNVVISAVILAMTALIGLAPVGCQTSLDPAGDYKGDTILYNADKVIASSYRILHSFVKWEYQYRATLPVEVSRAADAIRDNAEAWTQSAINLREAYAANPTKDAKANLTKSLDVLQAALNEASKYMVQFQSVAPPSAPARPTFPPSPM